MTITPFELMIPEGTELPSGYVILSHKAPYTIRLENFGNASCDCNVSIDGRSVGVWRIRPRSFITPERPIHDAGRFTFYLAGTIEGAKAGVTKDDQAGLVQATFMPEQPQPTAISAASRGDVALYAREDAPPSGSAGGTGLSGESRQRFGSASRITRDITRFVTISLRLIGPPSEDEPRPLFPRANPVPPPLV